MITIFGYRTFRGNVGTIDPGIQGCCSIARRYDRKVKTDVVTESEPTASPRRGLAGPGGHAAAVASSVRRPRYDLADRPFIVIWELTRACDLACRHCRAEAAPERHPQELSTEEGFALIDQVAGLGQPRPVFVMTGGDPLKRPDLADLVAHARAAGVPPALAPSVTPLLTSANLGALRQAGMGAVSLSLDGSTPAVHDGFRGVGGSFEQTIAAMETVRSLGIRLQVNSTVGRHNLADLADLAALVQGVDPVTWSVFFLVPTGRGSALGHLTAAECEDVLAFLYDVARDVPVKVTEAQHYRRVVIQHQEASISPASSGGVPPAMGPVYRSLSARRREVAQRPGGHRPLPRDGAGAPSDRRRARPETAPAPDRLVRRSPMAVSSGNGFVFVSHTGDVFPSGFLPIPCGNVRAQELADIYTSSPVLRALRDPERLEGKCGRCELKAVCGGSRARAYGVTGNLFAEEPWCAYEPAATA